MLAESSFIILVLNRSTSLRLAIALGIFLHSTMIALFSPAKSTSSSATHPILRPSSDRLRPNQR